MAIQHVNRKGKPYYLHQGVTKTGKPRYYFAQKSEGNLVDTIPEGFEVYENPNAQVFLRRIRPKIITDDEIEFVRKGMEKFCREKYYQIDVKKNVISIFLPNQNVDSLSELLSRFPTAREMNVRDFVNEFITYSPMLRFELIDPERRRFITQRYCFRGSIDDWIGIGRSDSLPNLVKTYVKHLGQDSYYDLH